MYPGMYGLDERSYDGFDRCEGEERLPTEEAVNFGAKTKEMSSKEGSETGYPSGRTYT